MRSSGPVRHAPRPNACAEASPHPEHRNGHQKHVPARSLTQDAARETRDARRTRRHAPVPRHGVHPSTTRDPGTDAAQGERHAQAHDVRPRSSLLPGSRDAVVLCALFLNSHDSFKGTRESGRCQVMAPLSVLMAFRGVAYTGP